MLLYKPLLLASSYSKLWSFSFAMVRQNILKVHPAGGQGLIHPYFSRS